MSNILVMELGYDEPVVKVEEAEETLPLPRIELRSDRVLAAELEFISSRFNHIEESMPLYVNIGTQNVHIGDFEVCVDSLVRLLQLKLDVGIIVEEGHYTPLNDPAMALNFVRKVNVDGVLLGE